MGGIQAGKYAKIYGANLQSLRQLERVGSERVAELVAGSHQLLFHKPANVLFMSHKHDPAFGRIRPSALAAGFQVANGLSAWR